jgi:hypothetical protein
LLTMGFSFADGTVSKDCIIHISELQEVMFCFRAGVES